MLFFRTWAAFYCVSPHDEYEYVVRSSVVLEEVGVSKEVSNCQSRTAVIDSEAPIEETSSHCNGINHRTRSSPTKLILHGRPTNNSLERMIHSGTTSI